MLDLRTARAGQRLFHLTADDVRAPFGVEVVQVTPVERLADVRGVGLEDRRRSQSGSKASRPTGYVVGRVTVEPATVEVVGPASALKRLDRSDHRAGLGGRRVAPVVDDVTIGVADPVVRLRQAQNAHVTVSIAAAPDEWVVTAIAYTSRTAREVRSSRRRA